MKVLEFINKSKSIIYDEINKISKTNPILNFAQPFIVKIIDNKSKKINKFLELFADENGDVNVDELIDSMIQRLNVVDPFTIDLMSFSKLEIGKGKIKLGIPFSDKFVVFDVNDVQSFKDTLINM